MTIDTLEATTTQPAIGSSFSLNWTDTSADGLFQLSELVPETFSGRRASLLKRSLTSNPIFDKYSGLTWQA